jgi:hypothetical protein
VKTRHKRPSEKWPRGPRYTVGSISGYAYERHTHSSKEVWYVHDAAYGYRIVGVFNDGAPHGIYDLRLRDHYNGRLFKRKRSQTAEQAARHFALILNRGDRETA